MAGHYNATVHTDAGAKRVRVRILNGSAGRDMSQPARLKQQACFSLGVAAPSFPRVRVPMQMKHGEHRNQVVFHREEHTVRKIAHECSPSAVLDLRKLERILENSRKDGIDLRFEAEAEVSTFSLESKGRFENLKLGLGRNIEPSHQRAERRRTRVSSRISDHGRDVISPRRCAARRSPTTWRCQSGTGTSSGCSEK